MTYLPWFWHLLVEIVLEPPSFANDVDQMPGHTEKVQTSTFEQNGFITHNVNMNFECTFFNCIGYLNFQVPAWSSLNLRYATWKNFKHNFKYNQARKK